MRKARLSVLMAIPSLRLDAAAPKAPAPVRRRCSAWSPDGLGNAAELFRTGRMLLPRNENVRQSCGDHVGTRRGCSQRMSLLLVDAFDEGGQVIAAEPGGWISSTIAEEDAFGEEEIERVAVIGGVAPCEVRRDLAFSGKYPPGV